MTTFPLEWIFVAALLCYSVLLTNRLLVTKDELRIERRLRQQAEQREDITYQAMKRAMRKNSELAKRAGMRFDGEVFADMRFYEGGHND